MPTRLGPNDARLSVTDPPDADLRRLAASRSLPERLVVGCFFRDSDQRKEFLDGLRRTAALAAIPDRAEERDEDAAADGDSDIGHLRHLIRQRAEIGLGYHAYSLKVGVAPYAAGCLVSFEALEGAAITHHVQRALNDAEGQRRHVLDAFGLSRQEQRS